MTPPQTPQGPPDDDQPIELHAQQQGQVRFRVNDDETIAVSLDDVIDLLEDQLGILKDVRDNALLMLKQYGPGSQN